MPTIHLKPKVTHRCLDGHPWVFDSEVGTIDGSPTNGGIVDVRDTKNKFVGRGYYNAHSAIRVRLLTFEDEPIDEAFFRRRLEAAISLRARLLDDPTNCRLVYSESDWLPGLIVDRFGDVLSVQFLTLGMDKRRDMICGLLRELLAPRGIYEKSLATTREKEGLTLVEGCIGESFDTRIVIRENGLEFGIDLAASQKTGYFFDQRANRAFIRRLAPGAEVLDCFTYIGSFALNAGAGGAKSVLGVDYSEEAVAQCRANAVRNGLADRCAFECGNCFDLLREWSDAGRQFDVVVLDPPAFAKSRGSLKNALRGYKEINLRGMKLVRPGGYLATCSCSYHVGREDLYATALGAAADAKRRVQLLNAAGADTDHPVLPAAPETDYLKFFVFRVW